MKRKTEIIWSLWGRNTDVHTRALGYMIVYMLAWIHEGHLFDELVFYPDFTSQSSRICSGEKTHLSAVCHKNKDLLWREDVWLCRATRRLTIHIHTSEVFSVSSCKTKSHIMSVLQWNKWVKSSSVCSLRFGKTSQEHDRKVCRRGKVQFQALSKQLNYLINNYWVNYVASNH